MDLNFGEIRVPHQAEASSDRESFELVVGSDETDMLAVDENLVSHARSDPCESVVEDRGLYAFCGPKKLKTPSLGLART